MWLLNFMEAQVLNYFEHTGIFIKKHIIFFVHIYRLNFLAKKNLKFPYYLWKLKMQYAYLWLHVLDHLSACSSVQRNGQVNQLFGSLKSGALESSLGGRRRENSRPTKADALSYTAHPATEVGGTGARQVQAADQHNAQTAAQNHQRSKCGEDGTPF